MVLRVFVVLVAVALGVVASFVVPVGVAVLFGLEATSYEDFLPVWLIALPVLSIGFGVGAHRLMQRASGGGVRP
jgi:hypothetical protein